MTTIGVNPRRELLCLTVRGARHLIDETLATTLGPVQVDEVGRLRQRYSPHRGRVRKIAFQPSDILRAALRVALAAHDQHSRRDRACVPQLATRVVPSDMPETRPPMCRPPPHHLKLTHVGRPLSLRSTKHLLGRGKWKGLVVIS